MCEILGPCQIYTEVCPGILVSCVKQTKTCGSTKIKTATIVSLSYNSPTSAYYVKYLVGLTNPKSTCTILRWEVKYAERNGTELLWLASRKSYFVSSSVYKNSLTDNMSRGNLLTLGLLYFCILQEHLKGNALISLQLRIPG